MNEIVAFILGLAFKSLFTVALGGIFTKFASAAIDDIREWPRVWHYISDHEGKSLDCDQCKELPAPADTVDTIR